MSKVWTTRIKALPWAIKEVGRALGARIRGEPSLASMPICVITTEGAKEDRERAIALGANEYLTKPIQANKVLAVAKSLLKLDG